MGRTIYHVTVKAGPFRQNTPLTEAQNDGVIAEVAQKQPLLQSISCQM